MPKFGSFQMSHTYTVEPKSVVCFELTAEAGSIIRDLVEPFYMDSSSLVIGVD